MAEVAEALEEAEAAPCLSFDSSKKVAEVVVAVVEACLDSC